MLSDLRLRLERLLNSGADVDTLLEEIIASLSDETTPADFPGGIALKSSDGKSPIQVQSDPTNLSGDAPIINVNRGGDSFTFTLNEGNTFIQEGGSSGGGGQQQPGSSSFPGRVVGHSGGLIYEVDVYLNGITRSPTAVSVTQVQGDPTLPHIVDGSVWAMVSKGIDGRYTMCLPVWE